MRKRPWSSHQLLLLSAPVGSLHQRRARGVSEKTIPAKGSAVPLDGRGGATVECSKVARYNDSGNAMVVADPFVSKSLKRIEWLEACSTEGQHGCRQ